MKDLLKLGGIIICLCGCSFTLVLQRGEPLQIIGNAPAPPPPKVVTPPPAPRVIVREKFIEIKEKIHFELDSAEIKPVSYSLLNEIVKVIKENPQIKEIEIQGHTDLRGAEEYNQTLSENRAKAVYNYLINHGIEKSRLRFKGFGETKPLTSGTTEKDHEKNRRVEFHIIKQDPKKIKIQLKEENQKKEKK
jgi:outer membrane protein OmpA-like peptidoglycan-associated protein